MTEKTKAGYVRPVLSLLLLFGPALLLIFISTRGCEHKFKVLEDYGKLPAYNFHDSKGHTLTNKNFRNKIVIYTTIQPSCPDTCAITIWHLDQLLYQQLRKNKKKLGHVKIVSIVTDANGHPSDRVHDVEMALRTQVQDYDPEIWTVVSGDARGIYNMKHNGQSLLKKGKEYFGGEAFTELMLLVDKKNHVRMVLPAKTESTIRKMRDHMALLEKEYDKAAAKAEKK